MATRKKPVPPHQPLAAYTPAQFGERVGRSSETIRRWVRDGHVRTVSIGTSRPMIPATEIDRLLGGDAQVTS